MRISVLSGKGGTGKTLIATNLAFVLKDCLYVDCDIEEPNGAIFLKPEIISKYDVTVDVPRVVEDKCIGCRECVQFCRFNALAFIKGRVKAYNELCHSCGGCTRICRFGALEETTRSIGVIEQGSSGNIGFKHGVLNRGEPTGVAIIKELLKDLPDDRIIVTDCPPGSSCTVMESIKGSDFCILVTEPTLFSVHNLELVYELCKVFSIPCGVVINKADKNNRIVEMFCKEKMVNVLGQIPYDMEIAQLNSNGELLTQRNPQYRSIFNDIHSRILEVLGV